METLKYCFSKEHFANWNGRADKREYLWFQLFSLIFGAAVTLIAMFLVFLTFGASFNESTKINPIGLILLVGFALVFMAIGIGLGIASITVLGRRLHDMDKSAWFILPIWIITSIIDRILHGNGFIASGLMIILAFVPGTVGPNRFGEDPKVVMPPSNDAPTPQE